MRRGSTPGPSASRSSERTRTCRRRQPRRTPSRGSSRGASTSHMSIRPHSSRSSRAAAIGTRAGVPVLLNGVSGHRDTGFTACPGDVLYGRLGAIAASARGAGGVKIFEPKAAVSGSSIRVRATALSATELDGRLQGRERSRGRSWRRHGDGRRLDVGVGRSPGGFVHVDDLGRSGTPGFGNAACRRWRGAARDRDSRCRARGDQSER